VLSVAAQSSAGQEVQVSFTGTIIGGDGAVGNPALDRLGLFGTVGANLLGDTYVATYVFNTSLGTLTSSGCFPASASCSSGTNTISGPPPSQPIVSESLTINGHTFSFGSATYPIGTSELSMANSGPSFPSGIFAEVEANSFASSLRNSLNLTIGSIPSSLVTPFTYSVHSGDGASFVDSFFQADPTGSPLDRFEFGETSVTLSLVPVPEPAAWGLMLAGLGIVGWGVKRRVLRSPVRLAA
jgi:hypothetical protein